MMNLNEIQDRISVALGSLHFSHFTIHNCKQFVTIL